MMRLGGCSIRGRDHERSPEELGSSLDLSSRSA